MNSIHTALFLTRETIMIFPLIVFCFIPVYSQITVSLLSLIKKVVLVTFLVEIVMFIFFLLLPFWISNTVYAFLCIFIFFYSLFHTYLYYSFHTFVCQTFLESILKLVCIPVTVHASGYESPSVQWFRRRTKLRRFLLCSFLLYITLKDLLQVSGS